MPSMLLVLAACLMRSDDTPESRARASLDRLAERARAVSSAEATWTRAVDASAPSASTRFARARTCASADGRFSYESWDAAAEAPVADATLHTSYYVYFDGRTLYCAYAEGSRYTMSEASASLAGWLPPQHLHAPWALIPTWVEAVRSSDATWSELPGTPSGEEDRFHVRIPVGEGRSLGLGWSDEVGLTSLAWTAGGESHTTRFAGFRAGDPIAVPTRAEREVVADAQGGIPRKVLSRATWTLDVSLNPSDIEARLAFDPVSRNVEYFDELRGDVYSPDRSRKLWNVHEVDASIGASRDSASWWRRIGLAILAGAIAFSLWRAIRARG